MVLEAGLSEVEGRSPLDQAAGGNRWPENGHHPHLFRKEAVIFVIILVLLIESAFLTQEFVTFRRDQYLAAILPAFLVTLTNEERVQDKLGSLKVSILLSSAAGEKARDMAARGYFSHVSPEGNPPWYWLDKVGYDYTYAGENLAVNFTDSDQLVKGWLASPAHRDNILKKNLKK